CRHGASEYWIHAETSHPGRSGNRLGLARRDNRWHARLDGGDLATLAPLFEACPVVCFGPESSALVSGPAAERRSFLDWSVFHVEPRSLEVWQRWRRALRQRSALLQTGAGNAAFEPWEHDLERSAGEIHRLRAQCLDSLKPFLAEEAFELIPELGSARLNYRPGWDVAAGLAEQLATTRDRDRARGFTHLGAHRADWSLDFERIARREHLSRGQAKAIALACMLALTRWLKGRTGEYPLLCLDDLDSELDAEHAFKVVEWLGRNPLQAWLTATSPPEPARRLPAATQVFHVKHTGLVQV
ncbi:MAG: DNA replication/repair protein RecF, partial [Rhodanobacteraceae bacterium]